MDRKSLRVFGLIWSFIFFVIACWPLLKGLEIRDWAFYVALGFVGVSFVFPEFFSKIYFYQAWIKFGNIVGKINSKIIIFILFFGIFTPIGIVLKIFRKDLLAKKLNKKADSYFLDRVTAPGSMKNQF